MNWMDDAKRRLAGNPAWGYQAGAAAATEPTALAALALQRGGEAEAADRACRWLQSVQTPQGSLGVDAARPKPCWPTGWAILAWREQPKPAEATVSAARRATAWLLRVEGRPVDALPQDEQNFFGHDTKLRGWPWVESTHSWVEPTAIGLLALQAAGEGDHTRAAEAVRLLVDRQLSVGGWNYGNTIVLGNALRPHLQPTGLALWALSAEVPPPDVEASLDYLRRSLSTETPTASLCFALLGLAAMKATPGDAETWLDAAARRTLDGDKSPYKLALLLLAAQAVQAKPSLTPAVDVSHD